MIQQDEWFQKPGRVPHNGTCLMVYVGWQCVELGLDVKVEFERVMGIIGRLFPNRPMGMIGFNDHPDTSVDDVNKILETWAVER